MVFYANFNNVSVISWQSVLQGVQVYGVLCQFQQCFSYIVTVRFTGSFGLWCFTPISTMFQLYRDSQFYREFRFMVFYDTFNNVSVILWQSGLQGVQVYGVLRQFQQCFSCIVTVSFTGSLGLWCFTTLSTMFQLYRDSQFYREFRFMVFYDNFNNVSVISFK